MKGHAKILVIRLDNIRSPDQLHELLFTFMEAEIPGIQNNDQINAARQVLFRIPVDFLENTACIIATDRIPVFPDQCHGKTAVFQTVVPCDELCPVTTGLIIRSIENSGKVRLTSQTLRSRKASSHPRRSVSSDLFGVDETIQPVQIESSFEHESRISGSSWSCLVGKCASSIFSMGGPA